jgi:hypothetical protein
MSGADAQFRFWLRENDYHQFPDGVGVQWFLELTVQEGPAPGDWRQKFWRVDMHLGTRMNAEQFCATGTLDVRDDARLLSLLGDSKIPIVLKKRHFSGHRLETIRMQLAENIEFLRSSIKQKSFHDVKRRVCGEWIDRQGWFAHRGTHPGPS